MSKLKKWLFTALLTTSLSVTANDAQTMVDVDAWQVKLAVGVGARTNPLVGGDNLPLVALPDIAYYGEAFYFDNGDLGYTLVEAPNWTLSAITRFNTERAYFSFSHPANIFVGSETVDGSSGHDANIPGPFPTVPDKTRTVIDLDDLASRKYAVDAGVEFNYYFESGSLLKFNVFHDVSGVYQGTNAALEYAQAFSFEKWQLSLSAGLSFKSQSLVDYYYGIDERDEVPQSLYYEADATIEPYVRISTVYPINDDWSALGLVKVKSLGSGMTDSPVVDEKLATTVFVGASYAF